MISFQASAALSWVILSISIFTLISNYSLSLKSFEFFSQIYLQNQITLSKCNLRLILYTTPHLVTYKYHLENLQIDSLISYRDWKGWMNDLQKIYHSIILKVFWNFWNQKEFANSKKNWNPHWNWVFAFEKIKNILQIFIPTWSFRFPH